MKNKKTVFLVIVIYSALLLSGCSYSKGIIEYNKYNMYSFSNPGNMRYEEIRPIEASDSGFVWESCDSLASKVAGRLYDQALMAGGNGVMNVRWHSEGGFQTMPTCKTAYGWFLLYFVGGLGPWVQSASAEGVIVKMSKKDVESISGKENAIIKLTSKADFLNTFGLK